MNYSLSKEEKLKSSKLIEQLFVEGSRIKSYPLQLIFMKNPRVTQNVHKVGFAVPKRSVKLAVHRNRIKRLMRETYRLNKNQLLHECQEPYILMLIYSAKNEVPFEDLQTAFAGICKKFKIKKKKDEEA